MKRLLLAVLAALLLVLTVLLTSHPAPQTFTPPAEPVERMATATVVKLCGYESPANETHRGAITLVVFQSPSDRIPRNDLPLRLPPTDAPVGSGLRLLAPQTPELPAPIQEEQELATQLSHAGGALEADIPAGWRVFEATAERQVFAVLMPPESEAPGDSRRDGIWFSHIALPPSDSWNEQQMQQELTHRLSNLPGKPLVINTNPPTSLGPWPAHSVVYALTEPDHSRAANDSSPAHDDILGAFMIVRTAWGLLEVNAVAPRAQYQSRQVVYEHIVRTMKLAAPAGPTAAVPRAEAANKLLGSWKSSLARIRLYGDARFEVILDPKQPVQIYPPLPLEQRPEVNRVAGEFELRDDVLYVTWNDGSLSNYRCSLQAGELLLTDHEGRISRLAKLYE